MSTYGGGLTSRRSPPRQRRSLQSCVPQSVDGGAAPFLVVYRASTVETLRRASVPRYRSRSATLALSTMSTYGGGLTSRRVPRRRRNRHFPSEPSLPLRDFASPVETLRRVSV